MPVVLLMTLMNYSKTFSKKTDAASVTGGSTLVSIVAIFVTGQLVNRGKKK